MRLILWYSYKIQPHRWKYFRDLEPKLRARIEDTELAVNILDERCHQMVKFDVFRRINTGGLPLNYQEIRNIMALPKVRSFLSAMVTCEEFQRATLDRVKDVRMGAQELCLRYLAILSFYDWKQQDFRKYEGLLKMMDKMILALNDMPEQRLEDILSGFRLIMAECHKILGEYSFCKLENNKINKSLFTAWAVVTAHSTLNEENIEKLRGIYLEHLQKDMDFYQVITSSTGTKKNILKSISVIREIWKECNDKNN